ncbi:enoyl-CoA hydratase/isomerase family protein [Falsigemmobacter faecalis]|uniref:3-hydroxyisobutyryl-CoA hydrolase n=1 Tax=Falsigemmobacter faecalis TaxID=2488730 RepID=A0A3P3DKV4_9RHOB|nr:enoyl-CoA hydratase/isomerase family protein [Falsigemmobacter faecalis]RRH74803.1 enoyl-CoA hydratase/isomerase family protein [Falsigemmobacter faecalis]
MNGIEIRKEGRAGILTLNRPEALNALTHQICLDAEAALRTWIDDPEVAVVILEGAGPRAFCSGGDVVQAAQAGRQGDYSLGRNFWRDEYRLNLLLADYPKPIVSFLHGFVMGGGVGFGGLVSHRVVGESTQVAMPECGIGLIPDVGGTYLLSRVPGQAGLYLGLTAARMGPGDAIWAGFADSFIPEADWPAVKADLIASGEVKLPQHPAPNSPLAAQSAEIDRLFSAESIPAIMSALEAEGSELATSALKALRRNAPLSMASTLAMIRPGPATLTKALRQEFRWTWRSMDEGDFIEGVRAQLIDKDRKPVWKHASAAAVTAEDVAAMLAPLGADEWEEDQ